MKKLFFLIVFLFCIFSCTDTDEGVLSIKEYNQYQNRLETVIVMVPDSTGTISILKYENVKHKDISIGPNYVTFPDSTNHFITYINCPITLIHN